MQNLAKLTQQVREEYSNLHSYVVLTQNIRMTEAGYLSTSKNEFPITLEGLDQLAHSVDIPKPFFRRLPTDMRAILFNRCLQTTIAEEKIVILFIGFGFDQLRHSFVFSPKLFR